MEEIDVMTGLDDVQPPIAGVGSQGGDVPVTATEAPTKSEGVGDQGTDVTVTVTEAPSNFLDQPFADYTPTEGLLLLILLVLVLSLLGSFVRRCFGWL